MRQGSRKDVDVVSLIFSCSSLLMTWAGFMGLLPRGLGPDLLWLKERLDAASTFIGQIKLRLLSRHPNTPRQCSAPCTFILINEAIPVINGSYYTRLYRTFSFYHRLCLSEWSVFWYWAGPISHLFLMPSPASLTLFTFHGNLNLLRSCVASLNILTFCWSSLMQYLHQLTSPDSTPVKTDLSFVLMN